MVPMVGLIDWVSQEGSGLGPPGASELQSKTRSEIRHEVRRSIRGN